MTMEGTAVAGTPTAGSKRGRSRSVLSGIALVLACLTIVVTTMAIWVHQVVLNTDRFTNLVSVVITEPAVTDPIATKVSQQVVDALDIEARIADRLPDAAKPIAGSIATAVQEAIERRLQQAFGNPDVQQALVRVISFTHEHLVALLRGQSDAMSIQDGYIYVNLFPVVGAALTQLQTIGLIPAGVQLPDLSSDEAPAALKAKLESVLGITLPDDFGTIRLMPAERLATAQTVVKAFDIVVVLLVILSVVLCALAIWLAQRRRRMVVFLAVGVVLAFLLARIATHTAVSGVVSNLTDTGLAGAVSALVDATVADFRGITTIILIATIILAIVAYVSGRPAWLVRLTDRTVTATSSAAGAAAGAVSGAAGDASTRMSAAGVAAGAAAPSRADLAPMVRRNRITVERVGLAAIAFSLVWLIAGIEVALLGAALVGIWLVIVRIIADDGGQAADRTDTPSGLEMTGTTIATAAPVDHAAETTVTAVTAPAPPPSDSAAAEPPAPLAPAAAEPPATVEPLVPPPPAPAPSAKPARKPRRPKSPPAGA